MKKIRTRVILTAKDWQAIYNALASLLWHAPNRSVLRKIGVQGMSAATRGVAPVRKRSKPRAPRF